MSSTSKPEALVDLWKPCIWGLLSQRLWFHNSGTGPSNQHRMILMHCQVWGPLLDLLVGFPSPGDLPDLGIEPRSPTLQADSLPTELSGKPRIWIALMLISLILHLGETLTCKLHMGVHVISSNCCELTIILNLKSNKQKKKKLYSADSTLSKIA